MKAKGAVLLGLWLAGGSAAWAVWPPSTDLSEAATPAGQTQGGGNEADRAASPAVLKRLEDDERRLSELLSELKKEEQALRRLRDNREVAQRGNGK